MKTSLWLLCLVAPLAAQRNVRVGPIDVREVLPLVAPPKFAMWWQEVVTMSHQSPTVTFERVEWWTTEQPLRCPMAGFGCQVHGVFLGPKDVVLTRQDSETECWVKHEMAHVILGRGDEAHGDPLFEAIRQSCR